MKIASELIEAALSAAMAAVGVAIAAAMVRTYAAVMRGNMRRAEGARPTDPQRDRFIIQPINKLKEDDNQRASGRCDPT